MSDLASHCIFVPCQQGTDVWIKSRLGKVTASRFGDVMSRGRAGQPSATAQSYMLDLVSEQLTGLPSDQIKSKQLAWGNKNEPGARAVYGFRTGIPVTQVGFASMNSLPAAGASSDGLLGDDGNLEIKCPFLSSVHLKTIMHGRVPSEYFWQVQGQLMVLGRDWCDFVSYDPRMLDPDDRLKIIRVDRDDTAIGELRMKLVKFVGQMQELRFRIQDLRGRIETAGAAANVE